jgi:hypothetical protein
MASEETLLEMARLHVRDGAVRVRQQRELVQHRDDTQSPLLKEATALLAEFIASEADHQRHLAKFEQEIRAGRREVNGTLVPLRR